MALSYDVNSVDELLRSQFQTHGTRTTSLVVLALAFLWSLKKFFGSSLTVSKLQSPVSLVFSSSWFDLLSSNRVLLGSLMLTGYGVTRKPCLSTARVTPFLDGSSKLVKSSESRQLFGLFWFFLRWVNLNQYSRLYSIVMWWDLIFIHQRGTNFLPISLFSVTPKPSHTYCKSVSMIIVCLQKMVFSLFIEFVSI